MSDKGKAMLIAWTRLGATGVMAFLLVYLLGAIPGMSSPVHQLLEATRATAAALVIHDQTMRDGQRTNRIICRGVWRGNAEMQNECGK